MKPTAVQLTVLAYLREHVASTVFVLQLLLQHNSPQATHQLLKRMTKSGLVSSADILLAAGKKVKLYGITELGLAYAFDLDEEVTSSMYFEPSKISPSTLQHELDIQILNIDAERAGWTRWLNGRSLGKRLKGMKIPDAIVTAPNKAASTFCVECEREIKSTRRYRQIIASHLAARKAGHWEHIVYLCPTTDLALRLKRKIVSLEYLLWNGHRIALTKAHMSHFTFDSYEYFSKEERL